MFAPLPAKHSKSGVTGCMVGYPEVGDKNGLEETKAPQSAGETAILAITIRTPEVLKFALRR
jgi:hypothetical protein